MPPKKIAFIQNVNINDHRAVHINGIASELAKRDYQVDVILQETKEKPQFKNVSYQLINLPGKTYAIKGQIVFMLNCLKTLKLKKYDIIHTKNPFSSLIPALIYKYLVNRKCRVIYDIRGLWIDFAVHSGDLPAFLSPPLNWLDTFLTNRADKVIAISKELKRIIVKRGVKADKVTVITGAGTDCEKIKSLKKLDIKKLIRIKEGKIICYLGSISKARNSEKIIEAFELVKDKIKDAYLVFIGPVPKEEKVFFTKLIKNLSLEGRIFFTGFIPHDKAIQYLKSCDMVVSYHEGNLPIYNVAVPTKILEYLASGVPIVTTNHKMYKNILIQRKTALLTGQKPREFAKGILSFLRNNKLRKSVSTNEQREALKHSYQKITDRVEKTFV